MVIRIIVYVGAVVLANFLVLHYGQVGLLFSSLLLIPFDFVLRCYFHEQWKGVSLVWRLGLLVGAASLTTYLINHATKNIALGSASGFVVANIFAGLYYQAFIKKSNFVKVNGSDVVAIVVDSITFQLIAFGSINVMVMVGQMVIKALGGLMWYLILFRNKK